MKSEMQTWLIFVFNIINNIIINGLAVTFINSNDLTKWLVEAMAFILTYQNKINLIYLL